ncbi:glycerophosphodiester phosphodiesterase [Rhodoplanes elegans]|uniref:Glycerophosphodiester phosphodiesterase n=1 Tax=Rhodoplanes elegans TaxID=29408 RepID=A0A327JWD5_9BRAD|nr:esterase-like activity of phytase family protein [Rhodoplanes elegans]MBK5960390.1 glycerophosphodiester phosphodiesterase [Rhodoplanes elegans]RAI29874.1 glycerophosphodiester phosphodiesterase [Rhodoplanes elegans]
MTRTTTLPLAAALALVLAVPAFAQQEYPAVLAGHAVFPARTFVAAPADAPADLKVSGKFTTGKRVEAIGSVPGKSNGRPTSVALPFEGQPVQGQSGVKVMPDGTFLVLTDNGFGGKANSPDAMLFFNRYKVDWAAGTFERLETVFLHDPDKKVPFRIVHEGTQKRYLTGADFDPEGIQPIGDVIWIGEEFGPYLIKADKTGKVLAVIETVADGKPVRSPDHFAVASPGAPNQTASFNARRSKGYEGFAASKDGKFIYGLLEGALWDADKKELENLDGKQAARILEFDVAAETFTGRFWYYPFEQNGNAIGDFNMIDGATGLVIERDDFEGTADKACPAGATGTATESCFARPAQFKRVYKIELSDATVGKPVRKIGFIDLMKIQDPDKKAKKPLTGGVLTFPFFTIENVDRVDETHIVVGNDNNLPFSSSREPNQADDNEFVLLTVGEFLKAK